MPWRYIVFSIVILTAACGASKLLAGLRGEEKVNEVAPVANDALAESEKISGRSIAPGGAGGRQS